MAFNDPIEREELIVRLNATAKATEESGNKHGAFYMREAARILEESRLDERRIEFMGAGMKSTNPKDAIGVSKVPMHLVPGSAKAFLSMAFLEGGLKYGKYNWRVMGVRASIYLDALERHYEKYKNGEDEDELTKVPHLASIMACCAIILDAKLVGKLNDDRPPAAPVSKLLDDLVDLVEHLQELYKDESPHQCVITDEVKDDG